MAVKNPQAPNDGNSWEILKLLIRGSSNTDFNKMMETRLRRQHYNESIQLLQACYYFLVH